MSKLFRKSISILVVMIMAFSIFVPASFATAPSKDNYSAKYLGGGKIKVAFENNVRYSDDLTITVKDSEGDSYKVGLIKAADKFIKFRIKEYKTGETYTYRINGVRKVLTIGYGVVSGKAKILDMRDFANIALKYAKVKWEDIDDEDYSCDYLEKSKTYRINFETAESEYTCTINLNGKVEKMQVEKKIQKK